VDAARFRTLLAQHIDDVLDGHTLDKGADYLRRARVRKIWYQDEGANSGCQLGLVQGSEATPYTASVRIRLDGEDADVYSYCTCPLEYECKHVAAVVLKTLGGNTQGPGAVPAPPASPQLGAWATWLRDVAESAAPKLPDNTVERVFAFLMRLDPSVGALPRLCMQPVWLKHGKRGGFVAPEPIEYHGQGDDPWEGLTSAQFEHIAQLRMRSAAFESFSRLLSARDEALLETLLRAYPCFMDKPTGASVSLVASRQLHLQWRLLEDGSQKLLPVIDGANTDASLIRIDGLWCWDKIARTLGRVEGDAQLVEASLKAPTLQPEQTQLLLDQWPQQDKFKTLPTPLQLPRLAELRVAPTPVATLRVVSVQSPAGRYEAGCVRISFDYAGTRLPLAPNLPRERRVHEGQLLEIQRDRGVEIAAIERLDAVGLIDVELLPPISGLPRDAFAAGDFVLDPRRGHLAAAEQVFALAPRLRELGFQLESADGFPFELLDEASDWSMQIDTPEDEGNAWFELRLGIDIEGERVDLLPILRRLLADPFFPLTARKGEPEDATWLVAVDERRRMPLPLARLRQLIAPLLEWLQRPGADDGSLRLRRAQASVLEEIKLPWTGGERLRAVIEQLRAAREPMFEPPGFNATLRAYQREGLAWLGFLADAQLGGVLADDMGLGKTVQVLAHLLSEKQRGRLDAPVLIVAPTSLVANWRDEAGRFTPQLSVLVLHGPARAGLHEAIPRHDLVITTYPLLPRDRDELIAHEYALLVLDEAQAIKNAKTQWAKVVRELPARRRLAMTGTPLENHLGELWAQFDAIEPGLLGTERDFTRYFRTPIEKHSIVEVREKLQRRIAPLLLRRRKQDVLADLPPKTEILRSVELEGDQRELYETLRLAQHERVIGEVQKRGLAQSGIIVLDALLKLRQACCDPRLVKLEAARGVKQSAKLDLLLDLIDSLVVEGRRILLFSQFTEMLALIEDELEARGIDHLTLTGQTPGTQRAALVDRFQEGEVPVFLISLKAGGVGLNLTAADTVIHYDPWWNPAVENQATDRAHRIGQDKSVFVYKLICAGTVEEKIQALQQRKADLARAVLEGGDAQSLRFDESDLHELFAPL
jgi:superfamily II DNA or RNA helicase